MTDDAPDLFSDVADFDLDRSTDESWASFGGRLADVLSVMEDDATLTVGALAGTPSEPAPFVRFAAQPDRGLVAELPAEHELGRAHRLTPEQQSFLTDEGWQQAPESTSGRWRRTGTQEDAETLAAAAVTVLRSVFGVPHPAFLAPDQLAEILTPPPTAELPDAASQFLPSELVATVPASPEELNSLVEAALTSWLGHEPVRDSESDLGIRVGSAMVFVRCTGDGREVLVFSPVVHEVEGRSRAMETLSDLNTDARFVRFLLIRDRVFVSLSVFSRPFVPAHLRQALEIVSATADGVDNELAAKLRGRTSFSDDASGESSGL